MKFTLAFVALIVSSSLVVDAQKRPSSYRRRKLSPFQAVCFGTPAPSQAPNTPTPVATKSPNNIITAPTAKVTPTCPTPPKKPTCPTPPKKPTCPSPGKVNPPPKPTCPKPKPPPSKNCPPGGSPAKSNPPPRSSGSKNCPPGGSPAKSSGGSPPKSSGGGSPAKAPGCSRLLKFAASALGFSTPSDEVKPAVEAKVETEPAIAAKVESVSSSATTPTDAVPEFMERDLQVVVGGGTPLNTTFFTFNGYPLPATFQGFALLNFPDLCFQLIIDLSNFIVNCRGCSAVVQENTPQTCNPADNTVVTPFVDFTEVTFNPYSNSTFFNTDSFGRALVTIPRICTGTGPVDNFERPLLLLDANGQIAACGILRYACP